MDIAVVGAGSWGTTLGDLLAQKGHRVRIWAREAEVVDSVEQVGINELFLPGHKLAAGLTAHNEIAAVVSGS